MKICFAINNLCAGGAERVLSALVNEIATTTDNEISAICFEKPYNFSRFYQFHRKIKVYLVDDRTTLDIKSVLVKISPQVVVSFLNPMNYMISLVTREMHIPHIACERNNPYHSPEKEQDRLNRDDAFVNAAGCVFQTETALSYFVNKIGIRSSIVIPNPVIIDCYERPAERKDRLVTIGRYAPQKNYPFLLKVFAFFLKKNPEYKLDCYGKNSGILKEIKELAESLKITHAVEFHEPTVNIHKEIANAKLFVTASNYEGMPNALAEAAALGIPCVASDIPGISDLVRKYNFGVLCKLDNPYSFASAIEALLDDDVSLSLMSDNGRGIMNDRSITKIKIQWLDYIMKVVNDYAV